MIYLKHRSQSNDHTRCWEYDPARRCVIALYDGKSADIHVSCEQNPRHGTYSIRRLDEYSWAIMPSMFEHRGSFWAAHIEIYPDASLPSVIINLSGATEEANEEMSRLFFEE